MREKLLNVLAMAIFISAADADPTVHLYITTLNATASGGTWQVYANVSDDNDGLANYDIDVLGTGGAVVNTAPTLEAPRPIDISDQYDDYFGGAMGFNKNDSAGGNSGTGRVNIFAMQNTDYADFDDPTYDMGVLVGVGQENSDASPQNGTQGPTGGSPTGIPTPVWSYTLLSTVSGGTGAPSYQIAGTLIEQGTYTTTNSQGHLIAQPDPNGFVEVIGTHDDGMNEPWNYLTQPGNTPIAFVTNDTIPLSVPEPASLSLLATSIGFLNLFVRRANRRQ